MEEPRNIDWDLAAQWYDTYVQADFDVPFFLAQAREAGNPVLELACGTGRISLPLVRAGYQLTGVDSSREMTARFRAKLAREGLSAEVVEADLRTLSLGRRYALVYLGFHTLSEVLGAADRLRVLEVAREHLRADGRFILTLRSPASCIERAHEEWRTMGRFALENGHALEVRSRWRLAPGGLRVAGEQHYAELDAAGLPISEVVLPITFDVIEEPEVRELAPKAGLRVERMFGDYAGAPYAPGVSPFMVFDLRAAP